MRNQPPIRLNLATHPSKNRKLFTFCLLFLGIIFLFLSIAGGVVYFSYKNKAEAIQTSLLELERSTAETESQERESKLRVEKAEAEYKETVDAINGLIFRKSFSWIDFLACLEASLPDSSYIVSLAPALREDLQMRVRFAVVSRSLEDLLKLINNLKGMEFKDLKVLNEVRNGQGFLRSEISLIYERNI
jgi:cell division protein FtsB